MKKIILITAYVLLANTNSGAQYWSTLGSGIGVPFGMGTVYSVAMYNGELCAGGFFNSASGTSAKNIAKWDGTNWFPLGQGLANLDPNHGGVSNLVVYNGELYASGLFDMSGGNTIRNIAKWNGTNWSAVGSTLVNVPASMIVYNGDLYVAGYFPNVGGVEAFIAKWNGMNWSAVGTGANLTLNSIRTLAVYNGMLYASGDSVSEGGVPIYADIVQWDGTNWTALNSLPDGYVASMKELSGELYAGGYFTTIGGIQANQIAKWNGTNWAPVGTGINLAFDGNWHSSVNSLAVHEGALYAGGYFDSAGAVETKNIAKWDGSNWTALGQGTNYWVSALISNASALYVGGWFNLVNSSINAHKIARWSENCTNPPPAQPGNISGNISVCPGSSNTYSISQVSGADNYGWTLPTGWTGNSTSNSIAVIAGTNNGNISVVAKNSCGNSIPRVLPVTVNSIPLQPGLIIGDVASCQGNTQTYSIDPVQGAVNYAWNLPSGWTGNSTTNTISTTVGANSGDISVTANNNCGNSMPQTLAVTVIAAPPQPGPINGSNTVCLGHSQTFSVNAVTGATSYTWVLPPGWNGNSTSNSIVAIIGANSGSVSVTANNSCGSSIGLSMPVSVNSVPPIPGEITGNKFVIIRRSEIYSINTVTGSTGYTWSISGGGLISQGQNNSAITIVWQSPGEYILSVMAFNDCGQGERKEITVKVTSPDTTDPFEIKLTPNPSSGEFYLRAKGLQDKKIRVEVLNMLGQPVYRSGIFTGSNNYSQLIDLKTMAMAQYMVKIYVDANVFVRNIVITK